MKNNPILMTDGYKVSHHKMYPEGTEYVYSNFTPRSVKYMPEEAKEIVVFGIQYTLKYIHDLFKENFFSKDKDEVISEAKLYLDSYLGTDYNMSHFEALHDLGFLPIEVRSLEEGSIINPRIPVMTIVNTLPEFYWITNFLETLIISLLWKPMHSASLTYGMRKLVNHYASISDKDCQVLDFLLHDFSFRGMQHPESAISSALGFLTSSKGTDSVPSLKAASYYYNEINAGFSVNATEHSVMCAGGKETEIETFTRLMDNFPTGILSIVSDTWDLWEVCTKILPELHDKIMQRDGKVVIRPDSGNPVDIICGTRTYEKKEHYESYKSAYEYPPEQKGVVELLWDVFGGTTNEQGYKVLDPHIGAIYGDSINIERIKEISERLIAKGFASTSIVYGVGSYSMGYATRDNQGSAVKATAVKINGEWKEIFKDPVTDDGTKKSAKGLLKVVRMNGEYHLIDQCKEESLEDYDNELKLRYFNGIMQNEATLNSIREKLI